MPQSSSVLSYSYDSVGNRMMFSAFEYDSAVVTNSWQQTEYSYGDSGGRPVLAQVRTVARTADETMINETETIHAVDHDAIGNVTSDGFSSYTYDLRNKLVEHADAGGLPQISFRYDSTGLRVLSGAEAGPNTGWIVDTYLLQDGNPILEVTLDNTLTVVEEKLYVHQGNRLLAIVSGTSVEHVISDHIGYPIANVDGDGSMLWHADHQPFGETKELFAGSETPDPLRRYPGQWKPDWSVFTAPTNLFYNGHRWYNPGWGRYTQADPIGLSVSMNLYSYSSQNPIKLLDPLGLWDIDPSCNCLMGDDDSFLKKSVDEWCARVRDEGIIKDSDISRCVEKRCYKNGVIKCEDCNDPTKYGKGELPRPVMFLGFHVWTVYSKEAILCSDNPDVETIIKGGFAFKGFEKDGFMPIIGAIVIEEWAHTCGWQHMFIEQSDRPWE